MLPTLHLSPFRSTILTIVSIGTLLVPFIKESDAWSMSSLQSSQVLKRTAAAAPVSINSRWLTMDTEVPTAPFALPSFLRESSRFAPTTTSRSPFWGVPMFSSPNKPPGIYGTPWKSSIVESSATECIYMPVWEWQVDRMQQGLTNFEILEDSSCYLESPSGQHRMVTLTACSDEYRYIRMTYLDGGDKVQVFTTVLYPRGNFPLFGLDLLQFQNGKRNLAICDFQPIHSKEEEHDSTYEHMLAPIRGVVPSLHEEMTDRFFDPSRYFSDQTLLGRFADAEDPQQPIWGELLPAYQAYFDTHVQMIQRHKATNKPSSLTPEEVLEHHRKYDNYVAERDPAHPMFSSIFGSDVAEAYVYDVLFPLADKPEDAVEG